MGIGDKNKSVLGPAFIIFALGLVAILPLRLYQLLNFIEPETGFYSNASHWSVWTLYGILIVIALVCYIASLIGSKRANYSAPLGRSIPLGLSSGFLSLTLLVDAVHQVKLFLEGLEADELSQQMAMSEMSKHSISFIELFQTAAAVLAAVYFMMMALHYFGAKIDYQKRRLLVVAPVLWQVMRIVIRFMRTIDFKQISDLLFELFMIAFSMLFLVAFMRFSAGFETARVQTRLFGYGLIAAMFSFLCSIPRYVALIIGRQELLAESGSLWQVCDLAMGIFIICYLFSVLGQMQFFTGKLPDSKA